MKLHANAALSLNQRRRMVCRVIEQRWSLTKAAEAAEVSERTCSKWVGRYRTDGHDGLLDRSSAPRSIPHRTPPERVEVIECLRRLRMSGAEIAECLGMALSTVSAVLTRIGLGKLSRLDPLEPANRYERRAAGELLHVDIKKLGGISVPGHRVTGNRRQRARGKAGWQFVHVCVDDATRLAYVEVLADEKATSAVGFLRRAIAFYSARGITVQSVMTDNGSCYRSVAHGIACRALGIRHLRTRPYRPRTNGKAERFIKTLIAGWNDGAIYASSAQRTAALSGWIDFYNHRRPHGALGHKPPIARLNELNNLAGFYN
ncbi:MAG: IS481 family transposase [Thermoleophilaceae bacterium]|nr:IS481 family transposase [Thermoleophilaceae bacterium]